MPHISNLDAHIATLVYGHAHPTQDFPTRNALTKLPPEEQITVFSDRYKLWMLGIAQDLTQNPNAGFAILALLNSYFDMIVSFSEPSKGKKGRLILLKWGAV